jgi:hypothetical protein
MSQISEISKYEYSRMVRVVRWLRLTRHFHVEINASVEDCIERLNQFKDTRWDGSYFEIFIEADAQSYRFMLFRKQVRNHNGYIIGSLSGQQDRVAT